MKSYCTGTSFHMVGRAWQIRIMLKQWMKETDPHASLTAILEKKGSPSNQGLRPVPTSKMEKI
ncbi:MULTISPECIES: Z-ring formation inhibitor MciZ [Paenibacillus]|uniref:Z-ring formation inhibitor MciZ n=1 Tax=Paenibacillus albilobatus TaxID=2716884 RepID=A0A919XDN8_9BACL|nr:MULTISPECIES: Z-ring formation inhibitor MciZ [Paenibacillus]GIO30797.1 hypothetical protein J2TS6_19380 [Paenibacillus albilobatus]